MKIRNTTFDFENKGYIMGILNVTPDSFSDGGMFNTVDKAICRAGEMIENGADIIDIGGESTRPGYTPVSAAEEIDRIVPVIEKIREFSDCPISVDSFKSETMEAAVKAGADICNDIWAFQADPKMADVVKEYDLPVILMHNKKNNEYEDLIPDMIRELTEQVDLALEKGISKDKIILDPGVGFALDYHKDLEVLNRLDEFANLGYPLLLGTSRKRFIGRATKVETAKERVIGTCATTALGRVKGATIFRVHDVKENRQAMLMAEAIMKEGR